MPLCWVCVEVLLWRAYCREKRLEQESPAAAPGAAIPAHREGCDRHWDVAWDVRWELRASQKGGSKQEFWVAKQSRCFGPTGLVLSSFFVFRVKQTGWLRGEPLGKRCHRLALLTPGASQAHPAAPGSAVQRSLPSLSQCHPCCTVSLLSLPCPGPWAAVPVPTDWLLSEDKVMPIRQWTCLTCPLAREGSTCRVPVQCQQCVGSWEEAASLGQTSSMGNTGRKIVVF